MFELLKKRNLSKVSPWDEKSPEPRPSHCTECNKLMKPKLHSITIREGFFKFKRLWKREYDKCEFCGTPFTYLS